MKHRLLTVAAVLSITLVSGCSGSGGSDGGDGDDPAPGGGINGPARVESDGGATLTTDSQAGDTTSDTDG